MRDMKDMRDMKEEVKMCRVVDNLKKERESLTNQFHQVKRLGVHTMEGRNRLMESKETLLSYLKAGNLELCPKLKKTMPENQQFLRLVNSFEDETRELEILCNEFFKKYELNGGGIEFLRDFDTLEDSLEHQMQNEGEILHAM